MELHLEEGLGESPLRRRYLSRYMEEVKGGQKVCNRMFEKHYRGRMPRTGKEAT